jgi:hypothetical protein
VNRRSRARRLERRKAPPERRKPLRFLGITCPVSPPAQDKTPRSLNFATVGFKLSGSHGLRNGPRLARAWVMSFLQVLRITQ